MRTAFLSATALLITSFVALAADQKPPSVEIPFDGEAAKAAQKAAAEYYGVPLTKTVDLGDGEKLEFVLIPAGEFRMGSPSVEEERYKDEGPKHDVTITKPYYMAKCELTQAQLKAFYGGGVWADKDYEFEGDNLPVENISWYEAERFCKELSDKTKLQMRLPTEAEWEFACRAGTDTPFYTGATIRPDQANYKGTKTYANGPKGLYMKTTVDVGSYDPNPFGLFDMHGNVWEWCADWYGKYYYRESRDTDPKGPPAGKEKVIRGGSWEENPEKVRSADRDKKKPADTHDEIGFRVAMDIEPLVKKN